MNLRLLQSQFQDYLMNNTEAMLANVAPCERFSAEKRLRVYFDAYRIRLCEILKLDFEKTHTLMGDAFFEQAFDQYITAHPSTHFSVRYFGRHFPEFLKKTAPFHEHPVLSEMAQFEWLLSYTLDAADAPILQKDTLAKLRPEQWPTVRFQFHPSVISGVFEWDTAALWRLIDNEDPPRAPEKQPQPIRWIFWRKGIRSYYHSCSEFESKIFESIQDNLDFSQICENLLDILPEEEIPLKTAQTLNQWICEERFVECQNI
jgi:hypothetical protein